MAAYFFTSPVDVDIMLEGEDDRKKFDIKSEKEQVVSAPIYYDDDAVAGQACLRSLSFVTSHTDLIIPSR